MTFVFNLLNLLYRPVYIVLFGVLVLILLGVFISLIGQALFWAFSDVSGYSFTQFIKPLLGSFTVRFGDSDARQLAQMLAINPRLLLDRHSHFTMMMVVLAFGVVVYILASLVIFLQHYLVRQVNTGYMRRARNWLREGRIQEAHNWVVLNLNSQNSVERTVGHVGGYAVTAYVNENRITGHFRNVLRNMDKALNQGNVVAAIAIADGWLKKPCL